MQTFLTRKFPKYKSRVSLEIEKQKVTKMTKQAPPELIHAPIALVRAIPCTMMLVSGSNSQVEAISTYFLFLSFRSLEVVPRQHGHHHVRSELYTKSEANGRLFAHPSGHLIELTMLYRMVCLSYGFSHVFYRSITANGRR